MNQHRSIHILFIFCSVIVLGVSCGDDDSSLDKDMSNCDKNATVLSDDDFNSISAFDIQSVSLNDDCLDITIGDSGCDPDMWEMNLYSIDAFFNVFPLQRTLKLELINNQSCLAAFEKTVSFDLTALQIDSQNEMILNIEGWDESVLYQY